MGGAATESTAAAATTTAPVVSAPVAGDIKPYRIHMSFRYLELTQQKLELSRLPHEGTRGQPKKGQSREWWEPKAQVEPLIDFWLEQYSWRTQESVFNSTLSQFRAVLNLPESSSTSPKLTATSTPTPTRIHFIHTRSPHPSAVPLLLIPPFPFSNLSISHLIKDLTDPADPALNPPFHVVCPSLPGLAFSDALPNNTPMVATTAHLFDDLMKKLAYPVYLASNSGPGMSSPAQVDWKIVRRLATRHADSCVGVHLIAPPFTAPRRKGAFVEWAKWSVARRLRRPMFKYSRDDLDALKRDGAQASTDGKRPKDSTKPESDALLGSFDPNALAYALCDSPTGLLVLVLKLLRTLGPLHQFSQTDIITLTELAWLPGPEGILRFWAHCARDDEEDSLVVEGAKKASDGEQEAAAAETKAAKTKPKSATGKEEKPKKPAKASKPMVGITTFLGGDIEQPQGESIAPENGAEGNNEPESSGIRPKPAHTPYACPGWGEKHFNIMHVSRVPGQPGLLAWERPAVVVEGIRELAKRIIVHDDRLKLSNKTGTTTAVTTPEIAAAAVGESTVATTPSAPAPATAKLSAATATPSASTTAQPSTTTPSTSTPAKPSTITTQSASTPVQPSTTTAASPKTPTTSSPHMSTIPIGFIPEIIEELDESQDGWPQPAAEETKESQDRGRALLTPSKDGEGVESDGRSQSPDTVVMVPLEQAS